jgi:site-specific DNA-methyltransferase (adenine-specific)
MGQKNPNLSFAEGELAWVRKGKNLRIFKHYSAMVEEGGKIHPTQKPVKLYRWVLDNYTSEGDLILDTHLGSGSIAIACHQMKRKLIGYEIDAEYYQKACKRFEEQTRQTALW